MSAQVKPRSAVDILRDLAGFAGDGITGIIRMQRLQDEARARLRIVEEEARRRERKGDKR